MVSMHTVITLVVTTAIFCVTLLCFSLRDFSRRRLEEICHSHNKLDRFGVILRSHQQCLLLAELLLLVMVLVATWLAARTQHFGDMSHPDSADWQVIAAWITRVTAVLVSAATILVAVPWTLARVIGESYLYHIWPVLSVISRLGTPIWQAALRLDLIAHRVFGLPEPDSEAAASLLTEELLTVVDESRREGVIQSNASTMIHRVVDLQTEDVAAIMTPRTDMVTINADTTLIDALPEMISNGFSRVPVIRDGIDDIVGILYARDLLAFNVGTNGGHDQTVGDVARDVLYAPESQGIGDLLEAMRQQKVHMAIVVDEYSGVSGLVTLEDILEEIVGEISDEYDHKDETLWREHSDGRTDVDARFHLDDLNEEFGYTFPEDEEFDTIGGFVLSCFGRIPAAGESEFWSDLKLTVLEADERHIIKVRIEGESKVGQPEVESA